MRKHRYYTCRKCGTTVDEYNAFGVGMGKKEKTYCRTNKCIPKWVQLKMWIKGYE